MKTRLSNNLQIGKAGEHLACFDLIMQGYNSFLSDQGLPFDILVEKDGKIYRGQVKTTQRMYEYGPRKRGDIPNSIYRFITRRGNVQKGNLGRASSVGEVDFYAFVIPSKKIIGYMLAKDLVSKNTGKINQLIEFKTKDIEYRKHFRQTKVYGKFIEDFNKLIL